MLSSIYAVAGDKDNNKNKANGLYARGHWLYKHMIAQINTNRYSLAYINTIHFDAIYGYYRDLYWYKLWGSVSSGQSCLISVHI